MGLLRCILGFVLAAGLAAGAARAGQPALRPVVVELYTSQGCSSCPPADAILGRLAQRPGILAISLPITYWDMLGWKDTLATDANTRRQKAYAAAMGHGGVYTPQVIVDGVTDVVGSRAASVEAAIAERRAQLEEARALAEAARAEADAARAQIAFSLQHALDAAVPISLHETPDAMQIEIGAVPGARNATVWLFRLRSAISVSVPTGENAGHTITYHNVAGDVRAVGAYKGRALSLTLHRAALGHVPHDAVAVIVQQGGYGPVIGAAFVSRPDYYAQQ